MIINNYEFGRITIDEKHFTRDVIIYPDRIDDNWWRKEGHRLHLDDLKDVLTNPPEILIIGTGANGVMKVPTDVTDRFKSYGIRVIIEKTAQACKEFNELEKKENVVVALHLTC
ncbi:MAG: Mth938-like domain-containing protein [Promethearchaeota archaeon]